MRVSCALRTSDHPQRSIGLSPTQVKPGVKPMTVTATPGSRGSDPRRAEQRCEQRALVARRAPPDEDAGAERERRAPRAARPRSRAPRRSARARRRRVHRDAPELDSHLPSHWGRQQRGERRGRRRIARAAPYRGQPLLARTPQRRMTPALSSAHAGRLVPRAAMRARIPSRCPPRSADEQTDALRGKPRPCTQLPRQPPVRRSRAADPFEFSPEAIAAAHVHQLGCPKRASPAATKP